MDGPHSLPSRSKVAGPTIKEVLHHGPAMGMTHIVPVSMGGRRKVGGRAPSARGAIVKEVMAKHGLSLPQASKYVKEHGLY